ncbi:DUF5675 family protein [Spirosoma sp.]|uniref:DUF5675 family protein n=1 Tax=Spirosoma sp. TaxID=1899569 RepID=UPI003B3BC895
MNIQIIRFQKGTESTLSKVVVDNVVKGYVLEDTDRGLMNTMSLSEISQIKKKNRTAIPSGRYQLKLTHSTRFNKLMPELLNVPGFGGIRIHPGNYVTDTEGCLLPGLSFNKDANGYLRVWESRKLYDSLLSDIRAAVKRNEAIYCELIRQYQL